MLDNKLQIALCRSCFGPPKSTYKRGFKRDIIVCDKGHENPRLLTLYCPNRLERFLCDFTYDTSCGYIALQKEGYQTEYYCSLVCLNRLFRLDKLTREMNDYDKVDILNEFALEKCLLKKNDLENKKQIVLESIESVEEIVQNPENNIFIENSEKLIEEKLKTLEKKHQNEINKLTDNVKQRDRTIFTLQCRLIELERKK